MGAATPLCFLFDFGIWCWGVVKVNDWCWGVVKVNDWCWGVVKVLDWCWGVVKVLDWCCFHKRKRGALRAPLFRWSNLYFRMTRYSKFCVDYFKSNTVEPIL